MTPLLSVALPSTDRTCPAAIWPTDVYPVAGPSLISVVTETVPLSFEISVAAYPVLVAYLLEKYPVFDLYDVVYQNTPSEALTAPRTVTVEPFDSDPSLLLLDPAPVLTFTDFVIFAFNVIVVAAG